MRYIIFLHAGESLTFPLITFFQNFNRVQSNISFPDHFLIQVECNIGSPSKPLEIIYFVTYSNDGILPTIDILGQKAIKYKYLYGTYEDKCYFHLLTKLILHSTLSAETHVIAILFRSISWMKSSHRQLCLIFPPKQLSLSQLKSGTTV